MHSLSPRILAALATLRHDGQLIRRGKIYQSDQQIASCDEFAGVLCRQHAATDYSNGCRISLNKHLSD